MKQSLELSDSRVAQQSSVAKKTWHRGSVLMKWGSVLPPMLFIEQNLTEAWVLWKVLSKSFECDSRVFRSSRKEDITNNYRVL